MKGKKMEMIKMCKRCLSTLLFILIFLVLFVTNTFASAWSIETVDSSGGDYNIEDTSIALDSAGKAHIGYCDST